MLIFCLPQSHGGGLLGFNNIKYYNVSMHKPLEERNENRKLGRGSYKNVLRICCFLFTLKGEKISILFDLLSVTIIFPNYTL